MKLEQFTSIYFIGAGGIGMSALVRYFLSQNKNVGGYDRTPTPLTRALEEEGADIHYTDNKELISAHFKNQTNTLIVYTPAIPNSHSELQYFTENNFTIVKRAEVLGLITKSSKGLCVAGTHGKTTTSAILAHLLHNSTIGCTAFLGGITQNYHTNLLLHPTSPYTVIEADEFDRSFHHLSPYISIITSADPDHLDIYGTKEAYYESFRHYTSLIAPGGKLIIRKDLPFEPKLREGVSLFTYSKDSGDYYSENIIIKNGEIYMDFIGPDIRINNIQLGVPISINIENSIAALAVAHSCGATSKELKLAMKSFKGVERRFDFVLKTDNRVLVNDYAHHPAEIKQSILSIQELYPHRKLTVIFQPHLYSRTNDFYANFAESLSLADEVILLPIYPAREEPIEGVTSKLIFDNLSKKINKSLIEKDELTEQLNKNKPEIVLTLGAGDINLMLPEIKALLKTI